MKVKIHKNLINGIGTAFTIGNQTFYLEKPYLEDESQEEKSDLIEWQMTMLENAFDNLFNKLIFSYFVQHKTKCYLTDK